MPTLSGQSGSEGATLDRLGLSEVAGLPAVREKNRGTSSWVRSILTATAMVALFHASANFAFPLNGSLNCLGIGGCYGVAAIAAYRMSRKSTGVMEARWRLVAIGLGFGVVAATLPLYQNWILRTPDTSAGIQDVALLLRGLPLLAAVCLTKRELGWPFAPLDVAQFVLMVFLGSFTLLFGAPHHMPVSSDAALFWITAANMTAASLASVRCFNTGNVVERGFFRLVAGSLWAIALTTGWINYYSTRHGDLTGGSPLHLVCDVPLLLLTIVMATRRPSRESKSESTDEVSFVETLCSMFVPACGLLLAALIVPSHLQLGLGGVAVGFMLYGVRTTVVLKKSLAAQHELFLANRSIQDQAFSDALTGIANRRSFDLTLEREWKRAQRSRQPLALLMLDVDHFKNLNDRYGHLAGDSCLREIARVLRAGLGREADFAARYGGEEFAILLMDTGTEGARVVGESLRRAVELHRCGLEDGTVLSFTVSIGVASEVPMVHESSVTLVAAADKALYRAKRNGRNRLEVHAWRVDTVVEAG